MLDLTASPWTWPDLTGKELAELGDMFPDNGPVDPFYQYIAVRDCNALKSKIEAGSGFAVLSAVRLCGTHGLVMPEWLAYAFNSRYYAVATYRALSWDDPKSFGRPYKKGTNIKARQKALHLRHKVSIAIHDILASEPETPIDKALFERVGEPLAIGATLAEEYYYYVKRQHKNITATWKAITSDQQGMSRADRPSSTANNRKTAGRQRKRR
ncbi:MAG: hypothetical protein KAY82_05115 [Hylemonella sp.]|nr:hypothetical protein [Hylemonella sp.]